MKNQYIIASLILAAFAAGCSPSEKTQTNTVAKQVETTQEAAYDLSKDLQDYTFEQKSEFVAYMEIQLANLESNIQKLSVKIDASNDKVKAEAKPRIAALREQAASLKKKIANTEQATATTWSGIKADSSKAYDALKDGLNQSRQWLADEIAP